MSLETTNSGIGTERTGVERGDLPALSQKKLRTVSFVASPPENKSPESVIADVEGYATLRAILGQSHILTAEGISDGQ